MWTGRVKRWIFSRHILVSRRKETPLEMEKRKSDNTIGLKNEEIQKVKQKPKKKKKYGKRGKNSWSVALFSLTWNIDLFLCLSKVSILSQVFPLH